MGADGSPRALEDEGHPGAEGGAAREPHADQADHGRRFGRLIQLAAQNGRPDLGVDLGINGMGLFGPARVDDRLEIMPWIRHEHLAQPVHS